MTKDFTKKFRDIELNVIKGNITQIPTDAIMTAINSGGLWFGGIDEAIQRVAGDHYHAQAHAAMPLSNLQTIIAKGSRENHRGNFDDVVFVVDDLESPVNSVIYNGLEAASKEGYEKILLPAVRMGVMAGVFEKDVKETVTKIAEGVKTFIGNYDSLTRLKDITFVIYNVPMAIKQLGESLRLIK